MRSTLRTVCFALTCGLGMTSLPALADPLMLFGMPLKNASRPALRQAIAQAGGKLVRHSADEDDYSPGKLLPGATDLSVVYLNDHLVALQYKLQLWKPGADEQFRSMLATKYGRYPSTSETFGANFSSGVNAFDSAYLPSGKYTWVQDNSMAVVFSNSFIGNLDNHVTLSYVDRDNEALMQQHVERAQQRDNAREAAAHNNAF